jgi:hypothetical protein
VFPILVILLIIYSVGFILWAPDWSFKLKFEMQVKMDKRIERLLHFELNPGAWNANFNIGIELKNGNKIIELFRNFSF